MVRPPPGVSSALRVPPDGLGEAAGDREAEAHARAARRVAVPLERFEDAVLGCVRDTGPAVDDAQLDAAGEGAGAHVHGLTAGAVVDGVLDDVGDGPLQEAAVDGDHRQGLGDVERDAVLGDADQSHGDHLVEVRFADQRDDGPGVEAGHVEEVADQGGEAVGSVLDAFEEFGLVVLGPFDVVGAQGADGRLDAGERGPQVVADGGEERGADAVGLGEFAGLLGLVDEALAVEYDGCLGGEGAQDAAVLGAG